MQVLYAQLTREDLYIYIYIYVYVTGTKTGLEKRQQDSELL